MVFLNRIEKSDFMDNQNNPQTPMQTEQPMQPIQPVQQVTPVVQPQVEEEPVVQQFKEIIPESTSAPQEPVKKNKVNKVIKGGLIAALVLTIVVLAGAGIQYLKKDVEVDPDVNNINYEKYKNVQYFNQKNETLYFYERNDGLIIATTAKDMGSEYTKTNNVYTCMTESCYVFDSMKGSGTVTVVFDGYYFVYNYEKGTQVYNLDVPARKYDFAKAYSNGTYIDYITLGTKGKNTTFSLLFDPNSNKEVIPFEEQEIVLPVLNKKYVLIKRDKGDIIYDIDKKANVLEKEANTLQMLIGKHSYIGYNLDQTVEKPQIIYNEKIKEIVNYSYEKGKKINNYVVNLNGKIIYQYDNTVYKYDEDGLLEKKSGPYLLPVSLHKYGSVIVDYGNKNIINEDGDILAEIPAYKTEDLAYEKEEYLNDKDYIIYLLAFDQNHDKYSCSDIPQALLQKEYPKDPNPKTKCEQDYNYKYTYARELIFDSKTNNFTEKVYLYHFGD